MKFFLSFITGLLILNSCITKMEIDSGKSIVFFGGHTYLKVNRSIGWYEARKKCESVGGYLVIPDSDEENRAMIPLIDRSIWIGLYDEDKNRIYETVKGEVAEYTAWAPSQPDYWENTQFVAGYNRYADWVKIDEWDDLGPEPWIDENSGRGWGYICEFERTLSDDEIRIMYSKFYNWSAQSVFLIGSSREGSSAVALQSNGKVPEISEIPAVKAEILEKISIVTVFDFNVENISQSEGKLISDLFGSAIVSKSSLNVIGRNRRENILDEMKFSLSGCVDDSCQLEAGKMLAADGIITGTVGMASSRYIINVRLLDVETSEVLSTSYKVFKTMDELIDSCEGIAISLISG